MTNFRGTSSSGSYDLQTHLFDSRFVSKLHRVRLYWIKIALSPFYTFHISLSYSSLFKNALTLSIFLQITNDICSSLNSTRISFKSVLIAYEYMLLINKNNTANNCLRTYTRPQFFKRLSVS